MKKKIIFAFVATMISSSTLANTYLGVNFGWTSLNDYCVSHDTCEDDDLTFGSYFGYKWNEYISAEIGYDYLGKLSKDEEVAHIGGGISALTLESVFSLPITDRFDIYGKIGVAQIFADNTENFVATSGVGLEYKLNWNLAVRGEYQYFEGIDSFSNNVDVNQLSLGIQYKFGHPAPVYSERTITQKSVEFDQETVEEVYAQHNTVLNFKLNSAVIENEQLLDSTISELNKYSEAKVKITGHTDSLGNATYNQQLGLRRAEVVSVYLQQQGISSNRILFESKGETTPIADNDTHQGRQANRRVEVVIPSFEHQVFGAEEKEVVIEKTIIEDVSPSWW